MSFIPKEVEENNPSVCKEGVDEYVHKYGTEVWPGEGGTWMENIDT